MSNGYNMFILFFVILVIFPEQSLSQASSAQWDCFASCGEGMFQCSGTCKCILQDWYCNGVFDCRDRTDEPSGCVRPDLCDPNQWTCPSTRQCISISNVCDNNNDCSNGEDEGATCSGRMCEVLDCDHSCHPTPSGGGCYCNNGFQIDPADNRTCRDYNECKTWGSCDQNCTDLHGTYNCSCYEDYTLQDDGKTCKAVESSMTQVYFLQDSVLSSVSVDGGPVRTVMQLEKAVSFTYHYAKRKLYYVTDTPYKIFETDLNSGGTVREIPVRDLLVPGSIVVDWVTDNLYVVEQASQRIDVVQIDGPYRSQIPQEIFTNIGDIAVDPTQGLVFISDKGKTVENPVGILRMGVRAGQPEKYIVRGGLISPDGLTLDVVNQRVYWSDSQTNKIESVRYDGGDRRVVLAGGRATPHPVALSVFENQVYYADWTKMALLKAGKYESTATLR